MPRFNPQVANILTALIFGFAYCISFEISNRFELSNRPHDPWLACGHGPKVI
jgi:hypothetical protein